MRREHERAERLEEEAAEAEAAAATQAAAREAALSSLREAETEVSPCCVATPSPCSHTLASLHTPCIATPLHLAASPYPATAPPYQGARLRAEALRWRREAEASDAAAATRAYELEALREAHAALAAAAANGGGGGRGASTTLAPPPRSPPPPSAVARGAGAARAGVGGAAESEAPLVEYLADALIAGARRPSLS